MKNDDLADEVVVAVISSMIQAKSFDFNNLIAMVQKAYDVAITVIELKLTNGVISDPVKPNIKNVNPIVISAVSKGP